MKKFIPFVSLLVFLNGCDQKAEPDECIPPSAVSADQNCFQSGNGLLVTALNSKKNSNGGAFHFSFYPQINSEGIDMSDSNLTWKNISGDNRIYIPAETLDDVTRFAFRVEMNCDGVIVGAVNALLELETVRESCNEWAITML